jgi:hypothetical protein
MGVSVACVQLSEVMLSESEASLKRIDGVQKEVCAWGDSDRKCQVCVCTYAVYVCIYIYIYIYIYILCVCM